jgi:DNA-binding XRE family transcriptional regulator
MYGMVKNVKTGWNNMDEAEAQLCEAVPPMLAESGEDQSVLAMQCRAARALLNWTQGELAGRSGVSIGTIRGFETDQTSPIPATLAALRQALEKAGVEFTNDDHPGVRMRRWRRK